MILLQQKTPRIILGLLIALSVLLLSGVFHQVVRLIVQHEVSKALHQEVTIERATGNLLFSTTFHHLRLYNPKGFKKGVCIDFGHFEAHYNPLKGLLFRGDFARASTRLIVRDLRVHILRDPRDRWNIFEILPPPKKGDPPLTFKGKIEFKGGFITFEDQHGWGTNRSLFSDHLILTSGLLDCHSHRKAPFKWIGTLAQAPTRSSFLIEGPLDITKGSYALHFRFNGLPVSRWGDYVFNHPGYHFSSGFALVDGHIQSKSHRLPETAPFWYMASVNLHSASANFPFFNESLQAIRANLLFMHWPSKTGARNAYCDVLSGSGELPYSKLSLYGRLGLYPKTLDIHAQGMLRDLSSLSKLAKPLRTFSIQGAQAMVSCNISGSYNAPTFSGHIVAASAIYSGIKIYDMDTAYTFVSPNLHFSIVQGKLGSGTLLGMGSLDITRPQSFDFKGQALSVDPTVWIPDLKKVISGRLNLELTAQGSPTYIKLSALGHDAYFLGQSLIGGTLYAKVSSQDTHIIMANAYLNSTENPITIESTRTANTLALNLIGKEIPWRDVFTPTSSIYGKLDFNSTIEIPLSGSGLDLQTDTTGVLHATLSQVPFGGSYFDSAKIDLSFSPAVIWIHQILAKSASESINIMGQYSKGKQTQFAINLNQLDLDRAQWAQRFIPDELRPLTGKLSFKGKASRSPQSTEPLQSNTHSWIPHISAKGLLTLRDGKIQNQPIDTLSIDGEWNATTLSIYRFTLDRNASHISLSGTWNPTTITLNIHETTAFQLSDFSSLLGPMANTEGFTRLSGTLFGSPQNPKATVRLMIKDLKSPYISVDTLEGTLHYHDFSLDFLPLSLIKDKDSIYIQGNIDFSKIYTPEICIKPENLTYKLKIDMNHVDFKTLLSITNGLRRIPPSPHQTTEIDIHDPRETSSSTILFSLDQKSPSALTYYRQFCENNAEVPIQDLNLKDLTLSRISSSLYIESRPRLFPLVSGNIALQDFQLGFLQAKSADLNFSTIANTIETDFTITDGLWGRKPFSLLGLSGVLDPQGDFSIKSSRFSAGNTSHLNWLSGVFPTSLSADSTLNLTLKLVGDDLGLLSVISPLLWNITNEGTVILTLSGPLRAPEISSPLLNLKNTHIVLNADLTSVQSPLAIRDASLSLSKNKLLLHKFNVDWIGPDTQSLHDKTPKLNQLSLSGHLDLTQFSLNKPDYMLLDINLSLLDTHLSVYFPKLYQGDLSIRNLQIKGPYWIPLSKLGRDTLDTTLYQDQEEGPILSGDVSFSNGQIITYISATANVKPSILLDINYLIGSDITVIGSLLSQDLFNSFDLTLSPTLSPNKLKGSLNFPKPLSPLVFSEGNFRLFDRNFTLLPPDHQRLYFADKPYRIRNNQLSFQVLQNPLTGRMRNVPFLDTAAAMVVNPDTSFLASLNATEKAPYRHIITSISGSIYDLRSFVFDQFSSPFWDVKAGSIIYVGTATLSKQSFTDSGENNRLFEILMPDLYRSAANNNFDNQTSRILNQFGENQINDTLRRQVRPVEKEVARKIGLYDVRLDYNLGNAILRSGNTHAQSNGQQNVGVHLFQRLFSDQLYIRVKTSLDTSNAKAADKFLLSETELTYYLSQNLSTSYSTFRDSSTIDSPVKSKWALKYRHEY